ncbi:hypothetical protein ACLK2C_14505 [Escherichia coli]
MAPELVHEPIRDELKPLVAMLLDTANISSRLIGIGKLDPQIARDFSCVGPMVRASGFKRDVGVRSTTLPATASCRWRSRPRRVAMRNPGCWVRIHELYDSLDMIEFGLEHLPEGPLLTEGFTYQPGKFALGFTEAPRGENVHWSMTGDNQKLFRWRCRAATYANWPALRYMLRGNTVADAPLIIGSLDPCYSCTDRVTRGQPPRRASPPWSPTRRSSVTVLTAKTLRSK